MEISMDVFKSVDLAFFASAFVLTICCLAYFLCIKKLQKAHSVIFAIMLADIMISALVEGFTSTLDYATKASFDVVNVQFILQHIYFFLHTVLPPFYAFYIMLINGRAVNRHPVFYIIYFLPVVVGETVICMNPLKEWVFKFDESGNFQRMDMEMLIYALAGIFVLITMFQFFSFRKTLTRPLYHTLWLFFFLTLIGVTIQYFRPDLKVELFFEALTLFGTMVIIENEDSLIDATTRLYNQRAFVVDNDRLISTKHNYYVITISFTNMRFYNRMLKVVTMDNLLHAIAMWIESVSGKNTVYRIGTNSFAILSFEDNARVEAVVKKLENKFNEDYLFNGMHFSFNTLITKVHIPDEFQRVEAVLELADMPNMAETTGVVVMRGEDLAFLRHKTEVEEMIKTALDRDRLEVYYQPIWSSATGKIEWCEALVRLNDTELGIITPENFVEIAEQTGQINEVGKMVFDKVCQFLRRERPQRFGLQYVEVNLSTYQLLTDDTASHFYSTMRKYGISPSQINLEITESASFHESEALKRNVERLRDLGFTFSLDDFGTGYSNLTYVINTDFENIKSDKGLLWEMENTKSRTLLLETIRMMRSLGLDVVQEGVETREQLELVVGAGANKIQGYYFSKPLPWEEFMNYLEDFNGPEDENNY
ncbi:MAG: GGDEF domain-containing protein [Lachnospiraceae bacterium]|nr:GGDEF domain-containing protein [Lachnospiraceae bacterium]